MAAAARQQVLLEIKFIGLSLGLNEKARHIVPFACPGIQACKAGSPGRGGCWYKRLLSLIDAGIKIRTDPMVMSLGKQSAALIESL